MEAVYLLISLVHHACESCSIACVYSYSVLGSHLSTKPQHLHTCQRPPAPKHLHVFIPRPQSLRMDTASPSEFLLGPGIVLKSIHRIGHREFFLFSWLKYAFIGIKHIIHLFNCENKISSWEHLLVSDFDLENTDHSSPRTGSFTQYVFKILVTTVIFIRVDAIAKWWRNHNQDDS